MISWLKYRWRLWRMQSALQKAYAADEKLIRAAESSGTKGNALADYKQELVMENWIAEDEITQMESRQLCREAHRYRVPLPEHANPELWEQSSNIGGWMLTSKGFATLRADIRKEKNDRWQYWELRFKVLVIVATTLTGTFGAAIGLLATWGKHSP